jgi:hypothetical protein
MSLMTEQRAMADRVAGTFDSVVQTRSMLWDPSMRAVGSTVVFEPADTQYRRPCKRGRAKR